MIVLVVLFATALAAQPAREASEWMTRGRGAIAARDTEKAVAAFGKACSLAPRDPDACYYFGRALQALDRFEEARQPLEQALANSRGVGPDQARIHRVIALNFVGLVQPDKAETHFLEAIRFHSGDAGVSEDPRVDYGAFLVRQARAGDALPILEQAVRAKPDSPRAQAEMGRAQLETGKREAAAGSLERAVALDPSAWAVRLLLGRAYQQLGRLAEAERELTLARKGWASQQSGSVRP
jgi:Flp pilus assembly protein TadD